MFPAQLPTGYDKLLLGIASIGKELLQFAEEHVVFLHFALEVFAHSRNNVAALTIDNADTNRPFAQNVEALFLGCHSHKLNLAMKNVLLKHEKVIGISNVLMEKLSFSILAALLRKKYFNLSNIAAPSGRVPPLNL